MRISKDDLGYVVDELQASLDDIPDGAVIDLDGGSMEQTFRLLPRWVNSETGLPIDGTDAATEEDPPDRFVQVIFLPATQAIFDRVHG